MPHKPCPKEIDFEISISSYTFTGLYYPYEDLYEIHSTNGDFLYLHDNPEETQRFLQHLQTQLQIQYNPQTGIHL